MANVGLVMVTWFKILAKTALFIALLITLGLVLPYEYIYEWLIINMTEGTAARISDFFGGYPEPLYYTYTLICFPINLMLSIIAYKIIIIAFNRMDKGR